MAICVLSNKLRKIAVGVIEFVYLFRQAKIDGVQLLIERLHLLLRGFQLLVGRLHLLVDRMQFFVGAAQLLERGLMLLGEGLQLLAYAFDGAAQLRAHGRIDRPIAEQVLEAVGVRNASFAREAGPGGISIIARWA